MPIFRAEMCRRLWWQIHLLNRHFTNICDGVDNTDSAHITLFDTKRPLNLNDADLHPDMMVLPIERQGLTEMAFCSVRYEIGDFVRRLSSENWSQQDKVIGIHQLEKTLEEKFASYCDGSIPLQRVTRCLIKTTVYRLSLIHCHGLLTIHEDTTTENKVQIFATALLLLQTQNASCSNPMLDRYRWHTKLFYCTEALFPVLHGLAFDSLDETDETEAWKQVSLAYQYNPELLSGKSNVLHKDLCTSLLKLVSTAWSRRRSRENTSTASIPPDFVDIMSSYPTLPVNTELHGSSIAPWQTDASLQESFGLEQLPNATAIDSSSNQHSLADDNQAWEHWLNLLNNDALLDF
ncbi:hypothetical protein AUEXF2481DRAFT_211725 [Aureobasidium subglaciale EXF-2481]|uniref:Transcription factor domain-containing protein n=1 Tax=Aureobasidium subglaciale (strain EXF-2481) TaxID=1043005 RepID=A0A074YMA3_AURSE|nr:uncharacterized protein AUEXF2481DRAFT_211725 [Aureobasidium subglaciale EXF-2481]KEQ95242.1 hypothetical protein AUEXF2481DRAFT_211725 [Aureobasidium subglaciale EXF-2481]